MRYSLLACLLVAAGATATIAQSPKRTVYLNKVVLEELKSSNPRHYEEATRVMAASDTLCAPGSLQSWKVMNLPPVHCTGDFLKTSPPPKRQISFDIDETRYIALVTLQDSRPEFRRADQDSGPVVTPLK
jgi:hypothetical protein